MIKSFSNLIFLFLANVLYAQNHFELEVSIGKEYLPSKIVLVSYFPYTNYEGLPFKSNAKYRFSGKINKAVEKFTLVVRNDQQTYSLDFFLKAGKAKIYLEKLSEGNLKNKIRFENFPDLNKQIEFWDLTNQLSHDMAKAYKIIDDPNSQDRSVLISEKAKIDSISNKLFNRQLLFIKKYPESYLSLQFFDDYILKKPFINFDTVKAVYENMSSIVKSSAYGKKIELQILKMQAVQVDSIFPNSAFFTIGQVKHNITDFRGEKYLLVCFWGTWCAPCVKGIPILKTIYSDFKDRGLEIVSIAVDDVEERWKEGLIKYDMTWMQTMCNDKYMPGEDSKSKYNLTFFPQYFLLNTQGRIIYHNVAFREDDEYSKLKGVLKTIFSY